jgi:hypothetical protein
MIPAHVALVNGSSGVIRFELLGMHESECGSEYLSPFGRSPADFRISQLRFAFSRLRFAWVASGVVCGADFSSLKFEREKSNTNSELHARQEVFVLDTTPRGTLR